ncbi:hypothetical protein [Tuwongella immobilis]|uniref:Uncharacterized protein n=1 Tax=Tuwongella immobilis TaxID=692036 RepID=A0A6C2YR11_9BACT|nr:hypothetical protein [Tuwongella immobilis]VIP03844.1 Uncharacterized protein OS=Planctomyces limnophilus (strain ATCC 43296 / DSM 3776 / IFAM 1008 / 290) GN=Plim_4086 PE=4 SV=1 [Tuwongella immobilis]VTS05055.1 Uncharacterized protein OS=Planctomyces limnophilus (strain ATCC 43296 / DSM 3776 / IFAM 1008 / 290) GN=Plim_4086 PE=4 SV=1 [Tuwongella immobilis]
MRRFRRTPIWPLARLLIVAGLLLGHGMSLLGFPQFRPIVSVESASDDAYPCQSHGCGCATAATCWQGDCCCFTLVEKVAWADAHGAAVPDSARRKAAGDRAATAKRPKSCCDSMNRHATQASSCCETDCSTDTMTASDDAPSIWERVIRGQSCRRTPSVGLFAAEPSLPQTEPLALPMFGPIPRLRPTPDLREIRVPTRPLIPPPKN